MGAYLLDPTRIFLVVLTWETLFLLTVLTLLTMFSFLAARSPSKGEYVLFECLYNLRQFQSHTLEAFISLIPHTHTHTHTHTERASRAPSTIQALFKTDSSLGGCSCLTMEGEITPLISHGVTGDNKLRWASFYFLTLVSVVLVVAAIVLTAVTKRK